jgi:hypothetical protein
VLYYECHKEPNKREKGMEKKRRKWEKKKGKRGKREGKFENFLASIAGSFGCSVAAGLPLNCRRGFCLLKPWRLQCPCS